MLAAMMTVALLQQGGPEVPVPVPVSEPSSTSTTTSAAPSTTTLLENFHLGDGRKLMAQVLKQTAENVYLDLGFDVLKIPLSAIVRRELHVEGDASPQSRVVDEQVFYRAELPEKSIAEGSELVGEAVVKIESSIGQGSGFLTSTDGYVVTNFHVVNKDLEVSVTLFLKSKNGYDLKTVRKVKVIAVNPDVDLALLKMDPPEGVTLKKVCLGDSEKIKVGEQVYAIGTPIGLERTVSSGIISVTNRTFGGFTHFQITTPINPGNSGGPLFNLRTEVVGVNCAGYLGLQGLNFAIPSKYVMDFLRNREAFAVVTVLSPDGKTDLPALCKNVEEFAEKKGKREISDLEVEGRRFRVAEPGNQNHQAVIPFMHQEHAVHIVSADISQAIAAVLNKDNKPRHVTRPELRKHSLGVQLNVQALNRICDAALAHEEEQSKEMEFFASFTSMTRTAYQYSGMQSVDRAELSFGPDGPDVVTEIALQFNQKDRGYLGCFFPKNRTRSTLVNLLPRQGTNVTSFHADVPGLFDVTSKMMQQMPEEQALSFEKMQSGFQEEFGLRLREDFLGLLGPECMWVQTIQEDLEDLNPMDPTFGAKVAFGGACFGIQLKDAKAFNQHLDAMLKKGGMHAARKQEEYKGYQVCTVNLGFFSALYTVSDKVLLLGFGDDSGKAIRSVLDMEADLRDGKEPQPLPKDVERRLAKRKGDYLGLGYTDVNGAIARGRLQLQAAMEGIPEQARPILESVLGLYDALPAGLLDKYKLSHQVSTSRMEGDRYIMENRW